jgi:hypothetical protein
MERRCPQGKRPYVNGTEAHREARKLRTNNRGKDTLAPIPLQLLFAMAFGERHGKTKRNLNADKRRMRSMPTPADLAKTNSEHGHQRAVFAWANMAAHYGFAAAWDDLSYTKAGHAEATYGKANAAPIMSRLFAIANGGARGDDARSKMIRGAQMKAEGVKKGVPDIMLPVPGPIGGIVGC